MLYSFKLTFQKVKVFSVVVFDISFGGMMGFISFMVGWHLYKRKPQSFILCKLTFQVEKVITVVNTETVVIVEGRFSFHSWEAKVPFFFPEKFAPHSLTRFFGNCFFFPRIGKKKTPVFFSEENFASHSPAKKFEISKKSQKR